MYILRPLPIHAPRPVNGLPLGQCGRWVAMSGDPTVANSFLERATYREYPSLSVEAENLNTAAKLNAFLTSMGLLLASPYGTDVKKAHILIDDAGGLAPRYTRDFTEEYPRMTHKEFEKAKAEGIVVLNPRFTWTAGVNDVAIPLGVERRLLSSVPAVFMVEPDPYFGCYPPYTGWTNPIGLPGSWAPDQNAVALSGGGTHYWELTKSIGMTSVLSESTPPLDALADYLAGLDVPGNLVNEALDEAKAGVFDLATELFESGETIGYLYNSLRRIILAFIGLKSREAIARKRFKGKELIDEITSAWMQFRYAASPLAYSIEDGLALLDAKERLYITARKRKDKPFEFSHGNWHFSGITEQRCFVKARVTGSHSNLGLNPVKALWEVTPLSFVINWVLPIGEFLGALVPTGNSELKMLVSNRVRAVTATYEYEGVKYAVPIDFDLYAAFPRPASVRFDIRPDLFLNWKRILDSLALSWNMFLKQHWKS